MQKHKRVVEIVPFALLPGLALALRVRCLDTTGIWVDQAFALGTAMRWVSGGAMPLASNKSSIGTVNPAMIEYLYAAAQRIWPDILGIAVLTMISGRVAVAIAGWSAHRVFGKRAALWTTLVFAVNPWSVFYSQLIWNQTMIPVFSALMLACLLLYFAADGHPVCLTLSFIWAACMTQVHLGSGVQLVAMGIIFAVFRRKLQILPLVTGGGFFVLLYAPYLLYESGVGWIDLKAMVELGRQPASFSPAAPEHRNAGRGQEVAVL